MRIDKEKLTTHMRTTMRRVIDFAYEYAYWNRINEFDLVMPDLTPPSSLEKDEELLEKINIVHSLYAQLETQLANLEQVANARVKADDMISVIQSAYQLTVEDVVSDEGVDLLTYALSAASKWELTDSMLCDIDGEELVVDIERHKEIENTYAARSAEYGLTSYGDTIDEAVENLSSMFRLYKEERAKLDSKE